MPSCCRPCWCWCLWRSWCSNPTTRICFASYFLRHRRKRPWPSWKEDAQMRGLVVVLGVGIFAIAPGYAQDAASGEKIFVQCKACDQIGEAAKNAVGPVLNGLFGRKAGTIEGYSYSPANKNSGITWDEATFREYIRDPKAKVPGTKMTFPGLKDPKQI